MPDPQEPKRTPQLSVPPAPRTLLPGFAELYCKSNFSFLEGASHPDELVARAAELGYHALAVTDRNSLAGVVRAHAAARQLGFKLLIGAEITPVDAPPVVLLATDRAAYGRLARLITHGRRNAEKGECRLTLADLAAHRQGLLAGALDAPETYREIFGDDCYLLVELHRCHDEQALAAASQQARHAGVPLVAAGGAHFHVPERRPLADVLTAIRAGQPVSECLDLLAPNAERYLRHPEELARLFPSDVLRRTVEIAERCTFNLDELRYEYPRELAPPGLAPMEYLRQLTWQGARERYPRGIPEKVLALLNHELPLIEELRYEAYFLTVWDLVRFARSRGILCQGRGSAANSAVCYCLGITSVDPEQMDVLFERFISRERGEAPDIDVDFEHERREEVLQYIYNKYGRERAGMTAEVITYRPRSAVRDVGKALGLSLERVDAISKTLERHSGEALAKRCRQAGLDTSSPVGRQLLGLVNELIGFPRHLSQHVGGMVMTEGPLCELVPIENASMPGRTVIQWDKEDLDELGILKVDCLALGMLTAIRKCFGLIEKHHQRRLTLADVPAADRQVYEMISRADTIGVFQIESRAQMSMLPRLRPQCFYDLVIEVAIVRPGPIQGNMVHPYLRRRLGEEPITYPNAAIQEVLEKTLGVPLFQEQAMRLAVVAAGFTPGEADQLRRAMAAWRRPGVVEEFRKKLIDGMLARGLPAEFAERLFNQIKGFGDYGFPESHAASFALLAYVSAWLKYHYPAAFCAALINSQPMGFYAPAQLVRDAQAHGVQARPLDVNHSHWDCTLEEGALRLGLRMVVGLPQSQAELIERARQKGPFQSIEDFSRRTRLRPATIKLLAGADAFQSLALNRRQSLWQALTQETEDRPLFADLTEETPQAVLPRAEGLEEVFADYRSAGLSLKGHPIAFFRPQLDALGVVPARQLGRLTNGRFVRVGGLVLVRQRPGTARGITFVTLEDETGVANLIIRKEVWERYHTVARTASALLASGQLQKHQEILHVLVTRLENLSSRVNELRSQSRDFH